MRSSRSESPKTFIWIAALIVVVGGGGAAAWLLRGGGAGTGEPATKAPTAVTEAPADQPTTPVTFPTPSTKAAEARPIDLTDMPTRPRTTVPAVAQIAGPTGDIEGVAINTKGAPVEGVHITAYLGNAMVPGFATSRDLVDATAMTKVDGSFKLESVPIGKAYVVVGEHDDYGRSEQQGIKVEKDRVTPGVKLLMIDGAVIRGTVVAKDGGPIGGARVELYDTLDMVLQKPDDQKPWKVVFTDGQGRYAFTHVSAKNIKVRAAADNYESQTRTISAALDQGPHDQDIDFVLNTGESLPGNAVDDNMAPVAHVRIEVTSLTKDFQSTAVAFSAADGSFLLEGLGANAYQLHATCDGYSDTLVPHIDAASGRVQVVMNRRGGVEGWVGSIAGTPIPSFTLHLMRGHGGGEPNYMNDSRNFDDPKGHFVFGNLDPGDYQLEARADDYADTRSESFTIARNDPSPPSIKIVMRRGGNLKGVVLSPDGKPLGNAVVSLNANNFVDSGIARIFAAIAPSDERERKTHSSGDGHFAFDHVPPGTYQVEAEHAEFASRTLNDINVVDEDEGGNAPIEVKLPPGAGIAGRALDNSQAPLPFCKVQISQKDNGFMDVGNTDADGYFSFKNLREGQYQITINPETVNGEAIHPFLRLVYASKSQKDVFVGEGQSVDGVLIQLKTN